jgi:hypothetical protein
MTTAKKAAVTKAARKPCNANEVDDFMRALKHPHKEGLEAVRATILNASPAIAEGIKWNAPSFRTSEWFATMNLRANVVQVIFHLGAKVRTDAGARARIKDPAGLLEWLGQDRASVRFADIGAIKSDGTALRKIVRQWVACVRHAQGPPGLGNNESAQAADSKKSAPAVRPCIAQAQTTQARKRRRKKRLTAPRASAPAA